jgi:hypothetical protein
MRRLHFMEAFMTNPQIPMQSLPTAFAANQPLPNYITAEDYGKGVSYKPEDRKNPMLRIGQSTSPFVNKTDPAYIAGAAPGCFAIPDLMQVFNGEVGIDVVPIFMQRTFLEWFPGRGGYADRHLEKPTDTVVTLTQDGNRPKRVLTRSASGCSGNVVEENIEVWLVLDGQPVMFPCRSTAIQFARRLNTFAGQFRTNGGTLPLFARLYKFTTVPRANLGGRWFTPVFHDLGYTPRDEYLAARELFDIARRGALRIDMSGETADAV